MAVSVLQEKVQEAGRKVPSMSDLAQGDAPTVPGRDFTPPKSLDEQLGAAKVHTRPESAARLLCILWSFIEVPRAAELRQAGAA